MKHYNKVHGNIATSVTKKFYAARYKDSLAVLWVINFKSTQMVWKKKK